MRLAYFYLTPQGEKLAEKIRNVLGGVCYGKKNLKENFAKAFSDSDGLVCIMAAGIAVRLLAPYIEHKTKDPAIVLLDQKGNYVISLLSGHLGGANKLAKKIAEITEGQAIITTATDVEQQFSFDVYAKESAMKIENIEQLKYISGALLEGKKVEVYCWNEEEQEKLKNYGKKKGLNMQNICFVKETEQMTANDRVYISPYIAPYIEKAHNLLLRPQVITIGIGCKKNREFDGAVKALEKVCQKAGISPISIKQIATIPRKGQEPVVQGLLNFYKVPLRLIEEKEIEQLDLNTLQIQQSDFVKRTVGVSSVSTASAYLAAKGGKILVDKEKYTGMTISIVLEETITHKRS